MDICLNYHSLIPFFWIILYSSFELLTWRHRSSNQHITCSFELFFCKFSFLIYVNSWSCHMQFYKEIFQMNTWSVQMDNIVVQMKYKVQKQNFSLMNTKIIHINQEVVQTCALIRVSLGYDYFWHERCG